MTLDDLKAVLVSLSQFYLDKAVTGQAYARLAESLIAMSGFEEQDSRLDELALSVASYSPSGGEGMIGDKELPDVARRAISGLSA